MAKSSKSRTTKPKTDGSVKEPIELTEAAAKDASEPEVIVPEDTGDQDPALDMEVVDDSVKAPADEMFNPEPVAAKSAASGGFVPLLLGGVVAGAIGYGIAAFYPLNDGSGELSVALAAQADQIAELEAQLAATPVPDLSGVEAQIADVGAQTSEQIDALGATLAAQLAELDARVVDVEKAPSGDGTLSATALAAYERELEQLRADIEVQQQSVMSAAARAEADLAAARQEAAQLEQEAIAAAQAAAVRAALNRVATAVETGAPFADALSDLDTADLPKTLTDAAQTGVATTAQLIQDFPNAARAALATARSEGVSDDAGGLGGFFRSQFDVRSTAPQEGPGPDAILSRAEAAIKDGRVADALAEIEALPEVARAEMTDWTARATQRADVLAAIATLSETYN